MGRVYFKPAGEKDLAHLVHFLFSQSSEIASQFHAAVEDTCGQLAESPELGGLVASDSPAIAGVRGGWPASATISSSIGRYPTE
jgi:plasmid stabilization system protein ParE